MENKYFKTVDSDGVFLYKFGKQVLNPGNFDRYESIAITLYRDGVINIAREKTFIFKQEDFVEITKDEFYAFLEFVTSMINENNEEFKNK